MIKKEYYNITNLIETGARYLIPIGQRANGKSYQAREYVLSDFQKNGHKFVYLRRWISDIKAKEVQRWFDSKQVERLFGKGRYVYCLQNEIYICYNNDKDDRIKEQHIGYYLALSEHERYKSWVFDLVSNIVYEEFITDRTYLDDEPAQLQHLVSTIIRHNDARVILIGNTISRICPYFNEWGLEGVLDQEQGTIQIYHQHNKDGSIVDVAVENCNTIKYNDSMFFGKSKSQIIDGEWDVINVPKRPKDNYDILYELDLNYQYLKMVIQLLINSNDELIVFVYPKSKKSTSNDRIVTDAFSTKKLINNHLGLNRAEALIVRLINDNKICFSDNLTGTDFYKILESFNFLS